MVTGDGKETISVVGIRPAPIISIRTRLHKGRKVSPQGGDRSANKSVVIAIDGPPITEERTNSLKPI